METISCNAWLKRFAPLHGFGSLGYHHTYTGWKDGNYLLRCMAQTFRTAPRFWVVGLSSHIQRVGRWKLSLTMHDSNVSHRSKVLDRWAIITHIEGGKMETISFDAWLKRFAPHQGFGSLGYHHTYRGWEDGNYLVPWQRRQYPWFENPNPETGNNNYIA